MVLIPFDPKWAEEDPVWKEHWEAHDRDECLPDCLVCDAMSDPPCVCDYCQHCK